MLVLALAQVKGAEHDTFNPRASSLLLVKGEAVRLKGRGLSAGLVEELP